MTIHFHLRGASRALPKLATALAALGLSVSAYAADAATQATGDEQLEEVVVTGTLIRGAAPVGSSQITIGSEKVAETAATTANELLATIPQVSNLFNTVPSSRLNVAQNQIQVVRPNLRNLTGETGSSSSTLVLIDGHRIAGVGVTQSAVDPDVIPVGAIERVEVVTDGGSATYGADAVGGVINFITRKRFDGVKLDARGGFADGYHTYDANVTIGHDWASGSLVGSFMYQTNNAIFGRDRDWIRQVDWATPALTPIGRQCSPGNVELPGAFSFVTFTFGPSTNYGLPNLTTPGVNACDATDNTSFVPEAKRYGAAFNVHQQVTDSVTLDWRTFYGQRTTSSFRPMQGDASVTSTSAFYRPAASNPTATQTVHFNLNSVLGTDAAPQGTKFTEWGTNLEIGAALNQNWQLRTLLNYSESDSTYYITGFNSTLLSAAGSATNPQQAINFYDPAATPNRSVIQALVDSEIAGEGRDQQFNVRSIIDGALFTMPGGEARLAAGVEYLHDLFKQRVAPPNGVRGAVANVAYTPYARDVKSGFGEFQLPFVGADNRKSGLYSLVFAGSARYDKFSDFGNTTNWKVGITYKPVQWLGLRGNYSTSFNAPSPVDQLGSLRNSISFFPFNAFVRPGDTVASGVNGTVAVQGSTPNLTPQTAKTYSFGFDVEPVTGLHANVNYYHVAFKDLIGIPTPNTGIFTNFPNNVTTNVNGLSAAQLRAFESLAPNGAAVIEPLITAGTRVYETVIFLTGNYGTLNVSGLDFGVNYNQKTGFGSLDYSISGNSTLQRKSRLGPGSAEVDLLTTDTPKLLLQAAVGATIGRVRAQATLNHTSGYNVVQTATLPQNHVSSYDTVNLFFKYDVAGSSGALQDLSFTLNVNNALDRDPPIYKLNGSNGFNNGFTLGRLVMAGVSKKF